MGGGWVEDWFRKRKRERIEREDSLDLIQAILRERLGPTRE